jgi:hypothetical protein
VMIQMCFRLLTMIQMRYRQKLICRKSLMNQIHQIHWQVQREQPYCQRMNSTCCPMLRQKETVIQG